MNIADCFDQDRPLLMVDDSLTGGIETGSEIAPAFGLHGVYAMNMGQTCFMTLELPDPVATSRRLRQYNPESYISPETFFEIGEVINNAPLLGFGRIPLSLAMSPLRLAATLMEDWPGVSLRGNATATDPIFPSGVVTRVTIEVSFIDGQNISFTLATGGIKSPPAVLTPTSPEWSGQTLLYFGVARGMSTPFLGAKIVDHGLVS